LLEKCEARTEKKQKSRKNKIGWRKMKKKARCQFRLLSVTLEAIRIINRLCEVTVGKSKYLSQIADIEENLKNQYWVSRPRQKKITDFFV
jgi:hypothetical protein